LRSDFRQEIKELGEVMHVIKKARTADQEMLAIYLGTAKEKYSI